MILLPETLAAWNTPGFEAAFKREAASLDPKLLPLQQGLSHSNHALDDDLEFVLLEAHEDDDLLVIKAGIFYQGIVAGCSCADDPTPIEPQTEYCEVLFEIQTSDGQAEIELL